MDDMKKPDPDGEGVVMRQSYPSPMVENTDAQYYHIAAHREHDPQEIAYQAQQQVVPDGLPNLAAEREHQHHEHEHHDLHELQELQEPPTPQQHDARPPVSAEELQLAAQLTQGLAQGMNQELAPMIAAVEMAAAASIQREAEEQQQQQEQEQEQQQQSLPPEHHHQHQEQHQHQHQPEAPPPSEPTLQDQLEASLQNHERQLHNQNHKLQDHNHEPHQLENHNHELQAHGHEVQNHNHELQNHHLQVQNVIPHPEQPQAHHHFPLNPPPPPHLPPHLSMDHLPSVHSQYQIPDNTPPRKRSKVSRACDECRRKKIKCDAQSEASEQSCSNCRRSSAQCLFSRVPQKRGPSKGYIKELADRLNSIEGKLNAGVAGDGLDDPVRRSSSEVFASAIPGDESKKRAFSSISNDGYVTPSPSRISTYTTEHRPILPYTQPEFRPVNTGSASDLTLKAIANAAASSATTELPLQPQSENMMDGMSPHELPQGSQHQIDQLPEIEDAAFDCYLTTIHPTFPVLASSKARVQSLLWQSSFILQLAFYHAFYSMIKGFLVSGESFMESDIGAADRLLAQWDSTQRRQRSTTTDLVRLQTLDMMLITIDCQGIASLKGQRDGWPTKSHLFSQAVPLAFEMRLYRRIPDEVSSPELDPNSDDNVALRAWWVLVMFERWSAAGTATPSLIADYAAVLYPGLTHIVGPVVMHLIRLSEAISTLVPLATWDFSDPYKSPQPVWKVATRSAARRAANEFPVGVTDPVLHLAYWHVQLLAQLLCPGDEESATQILQICKNMVSLLAGNHELRSPLTHHFVVLLCVGLLYCYKNGEETGDSAGKIRYGAYLLIQDLLKFAIAPSPWNAAVRAKLAVELNRLTVVVNATTSAASHANHQQNLQQLAELATNHSVDGQPQTKQEPMMDGVDGTPQQQISQGAVVDQVAPGLTKDRFLNEGYLTCFSELEGGADGGIGGGPGEVEDNSNNHHSQEAHNHHSQEATVGSDSGSAVMTADDIIGTTAAPAMPVPAPVSAAVATAVAALEQNAINGTATTTPVVTGME